jgi:hypothetical protein
MYQNQSETNYITNKCKERNLKDITIKNHLRRWNKINSNLTQEQLHNEPMDVCNDMIAWIETQALTSQRTYLNTLCLFYGEKGKERKYQNAMWKKSADLLAKKSIEYYEKKSKQKKTQKEIDQWREWSKCVELRNKLQYKYKKNKKLKLNLKTNKISKTRLFEFQDYLICCLYTDIIPKRCEYANVKTIVNYKSLTQEEKDNGNFLEVINKKKKIFWFGKNACKATAKKNEPVKVPKQLNYVLNLWFHLTSAYYNNNTMGELIGDYKTDEERAEKIKKILIDKHNYEENMNWLLLDQNFVKMKESILSKKVKKIFGGGVSMLRKSYSTHIGKNDTPLEVKNEICRVMNHSSKVHDLHYVKH